MKRKHAVLEFCIMCLLAYLGTASAQSLPCSFTFQLSPKGYSVLGLANTFRNDDGEDRLALEWAKCHETELNTRLKSSPSFLLKIKTLRSEYQLFRKAEADVASRLAGGGTLYRHSVPRSFPQIEIVLNDYVLVSQRTNNTIDNIDAEIQINITLQQMRNRLSSLRKLKPDIDTTLTTQQKDTELDAYNASVARYELAYRALIETLGDGASPRNSIVMQSLYSSQFLDYALR